MFKTMYRLLLLRLTWGHSVRDHGLVKLKCQGNKSGKGLEKAVEKEEVHG